MKIWTEIAEDRLAGNFHALRRILEDGHHSTTPVELLAVVKANAYGHGIHPCAAVLARAGATWLGVTDAHEGARAREALESAGIPLPHQPDILVMSGTAALAAEAECILRHRLTAVVWSAEHLARLASAARGAGTVAQVHLEVDTGMSRQGVAPGHALDRILHAIAQSPNLALDGVLTHFASTELPASVQTADQQRRFETAIAQLAASPLRPRWLHVGNSSYIDNDTTEIDTADSNTTDTNTHQRESLHWLRRTAAALGARAMLRSGLALYGHLLPIEGDAPPLAAPHLLPVLTWKTRIIGVQHIQPGATVGYNATYVANRPMRLALLPVGYADGLRRELSSTNACPGGWVIVRGRRAPIVGRISMNLTTVDLSAIPDAADGDEVVLLGHGVTAQDHARLARTIPYEILCGLRTSP